MKRVVVVGSGISGLAVAHALASEAHVTHFEADHHFGGHSHTVEVQLDGVSHGVDTGFLVFNERTDPSLMRLFAELDVETARAEKSGRAARRRRGQRARIVSWREGLALVGVLVAGVLPSVAGLSVTSALFTVALAVGVA